MSIIDDMRKCYKEVMERDAVDYDRRMIRMHTDTVESLKAKHGFDGSALLGLKIIVDDSVSVGSMRWDYSNYAEPTIP